MKEYMEKIGAMLKPSNAFNQNNIMIKSFKIATWNANRLVKYSQEIKIFIFNRNIDILFLKHISLARVFTYSWIYVGYHNTS